MPSDKDIDLWLERVTEDGVNLSAWEEEFIADITEQWRRDRRLTDKQVAVLEKIYTDRTP